MGLVDTDLHGHLDSHYVGWRRTDNGLHYLEAVAVERREVCPAYRGVPIPWHPWDLTDCLRAERPRPDISSPRGRRLDSESLCGPDPGGRLVALLFLGRL